MANYVVLDTETAPTVNHGDDKAHPETSLVYDLGYTIRDHNDNELCRRSFLITDVFYNPAWMNSAYYVEKLPQYRENLADSMENCDCDLQWYPIDFLSAWKQFKADCALYKVKTAWAYNARFDRTVLNHTIDFMSNGFVRFFFPYKMKVRDVWDYASNITGTKPYVAWCVENGYFTASGNPMTGAEVVYRYLMQDNEFIEQHTGYSDSCIENYILRCAKKRKSKTRHSMGQGYRDASKVYKSLYK